MRSRYVLRAFRASPIRCVGERIKATGVPEFREVAWRACNAVLGSGGYVLQHRVERSVLKKEEERALHSVLCGLVDMGAERTFNVDMIADKVYSRYDDDITSKAKETRRKSIRNACAAIDDLDYWSCFASGVGVNAVMKVKRKRRKDIF